MEENQSFRKALEEADLDELIMRLGLYTQRRLAGMFWRGDSQGSIPGGYEAADFIQAAFKKGLTEERVWKASKHSLFDFLQGIISSDINNQALKIENRVESRIGTATEADNKRIILDVPGRASDSPDSGLLRGEEQQLILQRIGENELDRGVIQCVLGDMLSVSEIAAKLNVPATEIYKSKKRLKRKLEYLRTSIESD